MGVCVEIQNCVFVLADMMVVSPLANGLAFVFTFLTEAYVESRVPELGKLAKLL